MMSRLMGPFPTGRGRSAQDPFSDLHREMNRLFDDFIGLGGSAAPPGVSGQLMSMPRLDVREDQQEICIYAEVPGVKPSELDLRIEGSVITIRGEKKNAAAEQQQDYHVIERSFGRFQRSIQLPFEPDAQQVRAEFEHGVLTVHVPKQPQPERSRRIEIQASDGQTEDARPGGASQQALAAPDAGRQTPQPPQEHSEQRTRH
ncbi:Hsp20/alpha crystallin family protein [Ramlibacter sp. AN1015]|uniref:Hsp20/alpha crystallin family protein n=1 Tax=Ramlibacter sp. AN1015 TaxID=3133428 RepID=UPI0030BE40EE